MPVKVLSPAVSDTKSGSSASPAHVWDRICIGLFAIISLIYFRDAIAIGARAPMWMDEVLALWTARQPDLAGVWSALQRGSEFTPPLYDSALHMWLKTGVSSTLMLRLPSIVAGYLAALATGALVRRHAGWSLAALAAGAMLTGPQFEYAVQVRPYIFVAAAFGWALVVWDGLPQHGRMPLPRLLGLGALLTAMVALHFYAVLLVATLGLAEVIRRGAIGRLPRIAVIATVLVSIATIACWWPIMQAASLYSRQDVFAPSYYGRPLVIRLVGDYCYLAGLPGAIAAVLAGALLVQHRRTRRDVPLGLLALVLCAIPAIVFTFALLVSHSFVMRYALTGAFGFAVGLVWVVRQWNTGQAQGAAIILMILALLCHQRGTIEVTKPDRLQVLALVGPAPDDVPIAVGNGLRYLELVANLPPSQTRNIVYLDLPDVPAGDPTNMHQVERWKVIDPRLRVVNAQRFVCTTPRFRLLTEPDEELPGWLRGRALFSPPPTDRPALIPVQSLPCRKSA